ncbi:MAG TPA: sulfite exporter TauE/SafE family protein [Actinobacteria bacterium]|nr:sulfite exporter TauE/SafE family protein [Actinomycetota bacterium]
MIDLLSGLDFTAAEAGFAGAVLALAAFVRGYSGFGFSAVLVAGLTFLIEPVAAVPLAIVFEVVASVFQAPSIWREVRWRDFWVLLASAVVGNPIGVALLTRADGDVLRSVTFAVLLVLSLAMLVSHRGRLVSTPVLLFTVGIVAGVVNGATALSGLVLVLAISFTTIAVAEMRATLIVYFFASNAVVIGLLAVDGSIAGSLWNRVTVGLPLLAVGIFVGSKVFRRSTPESLRRGTLGLLIAVSAVGLVRMLAL